MKTARFLNEIEAKRRRFRRSRSVATGLLGAAVLVFLAARLFLPPSFGARLISAHQRLIGAAVGIGHDIGDQLAV